MHFWHLMNKLLKIFWSVLYKLPVFLTQYLFKFAVCVDYLFNSSCHTEYLRDSLSDVCKMC